MKHFFKIAAMCALLGTVRIAQAWNYTITNGTRYTIKVSLRGHASVWNASDMIAGLQSNILAPGQTRTFYIGKRISSDDQGRWIKDGSDGWNVGVCLASIGVEFLQPKRWSAATGQLLPRRYLAMHPITGMPLNTNITIIQMPTNKYTQFQASMTKIKNAITDANKVEYGGDNTQSQAVGDVAEVGTNILTTAMTPQDIALDGAITAATAIINAATDIYAGSICRDREFFLSEVPIINAAGGVDYIDYQFNRPDENGVIINRTMRYPMTTFEFVTQDT